MFRDKNWIYNYDVYYFNKDLNMNRILSTLTRIPKYTPRFAFAGDKLKDRDLGEERVFFTKEDCNSV